MNTPGPLARIAGLLYLIVAVGGAFGIWVRTRIVEPGDAAATADNLRASAALFRAGLLSDLVAGTCFLLTVIALYALFRHVHGPAAVAMLTIAAVGVAISSLNVHNAYTALDIAASGDYARTFGAAGAEHLAMLYVDAGGNAGTIAYVFYGLWLAPLGYLVIRSGYFPRTLGLALIVGCIGYLTGVFTDVLVPTVGEGIGLLFGLVGALPELAFLAWLLAKGVQVPATEHTERSEARV